MDVFVVLEGFQEAGVAGEVRQDAQLDLRIVRGEQHRLRPEVTRDKCAPDRVTEVGAHRDVLQVRVLRRKASRGRDHLVEVGVDASGIGMHKRRQRIDVR